MTKDTSSSPSTSSQEKPKFSSEGQSPPLGILLALISATSFGSVTSFARMAYDDGATPFSLIMFRNGSGLLVALVLFFFFRHRMKVPKQSIIPMFFVTLGVTMMTVGYMSAVNYISVSLSALIFYTYPLIVLIITSITDRQFPGVIRSSAFCIAFLGLALAIGPSLDNLNVTGLIFASCASLGGVLIFIATPKANKYMHSYTLFTGTQIGGMIMCLMVLPFLGDFILPNGQTGYISMMIASLLYVGALFINFSAIRYAGPSLAAIVYNIEPMIAIALAAILLGEVLSPTQYAGCALVLFAILIASWRQRERKLQKGA